MKLTQLDTTKHIVLTAAMWKKKVFPYQNICLSYKSDNGAWITLKLAGYDAENLIKQVHLAKAEDGSVTAVGNVSGGVPIRGSHDKIVINNADTSASQASGTEPSQPTPDQGHVSGNGLLVLDQQLREKLFSIFRVFMYMRIDTYYDASNVSAFAKWRRMAGTLTGEHDRHRWIDVASLGLPADPGKLQTSQFTCTVDSSDELNHNGVYIYVDSQLIFGSSYVKVDYSSDEIIAKTEAHGKYPRLSDVDPSAWPGDDAKPGHKWSSYSFAWFVNGSWLGVGGYRTRAPVRPGLLLTDTAIVIPGFSLPVDCAISHLSTVVPGPLSNMDQHRVALSMIYRGYINDAVDANKTRQRIDILREKGLFSDVDEPYRATRELTASSFKSGWSISPDELSDFMACTGFPLSKSMFTKTPTFLSTGASVVPIAMGFGDKYAHKAGREIVTYTPEAGNITFRTQDRGKIVPWFRGKEGEDAFHYLMYPWQLSSSGFVRPSVFSGMRTLMDNGLESDYGCLGANISTPILSDFLNDDSSEHIESFMSSRLKGYRDNLFRGSVYIESAYKVFDNIVPPMTKGGARNRATGYVAAEDTVGLEFGDGISACFSGLFMGYKNPRDTYLSGIASLAPYFSPGEEYSRQVGPRDDRELRTIAYADDNHFDQVRERPWPALYATAAFMPRNVICHNYRHSLDKYSIFAMYGLLIGQVDVPMDLAVRRSIGRAVSRPYKYTSSSIPVDDSMYI